LVVYGTETGTAEKLARAMADALSVHGEASASRIEEIAGLERDGIDLLKYTGSCAGSAAGFWHRWRAPSLQESKALRSLGRTPPGVVR
jgi:hypothetical protein